MFRPGHMVAEVTGRQPLPFARSGRDTGDLSGVPACVIAWSARLPGFRPVSAAGATAAVVLPVPPGCTRQPDPRHPIERNRPGPAPDRAFRTPGGPPSRFSQSFALCETMAEIPQL